MPDPIRSLTVEQLRFGADLVDIVFTHRMDDETFQGTWAWASDDKYLFADHNRDGNAFTNYGGALAGSSTGTPVQVIFWGSWWTTAAGSTRHTDLEDGVKRLLGLRYWTGLAQYGIPHAPIWRGSTIVTSPAPPANGNGATQATLDLIDALIDDDVFPDPDDGDRISFIAFMPQGFVETTAQGAHSTDYDYDFPFDTDAFWAGWVSFKATVDNTLMVFSHELTEILTDPERDAWHTERNTSSNEISDAGGSPQPGVAPYDNGRTDQTAYVAGIKVQSYFSNADNAPIIPVEKGYRAQLTAVSRETDRRKAAEGTFRPKAFVGICVEDRDYWWRSYEVAHHVDVSLDSHAFQSAVVGANAARAWSLNGQPVPIGNGSIALPVTVEAYVGRSLAPQPTNVTIAYRATPTELDLDIGNPVGNFDLVVSATVTDTPITGNVRIQPTCQPSVIVGITGADLVDDPAYEQQLEHCMDVFKRRYIEDVRVGGRPRPGDPPNVDFGTLTKDLPGFVAPATFARIQLAKKTIRAAFATSTPEEARELTSQLIEDMPVLARFVGVDRVFRDLDTPMETRWEEATPESGEPTAT